MIDHLKSALVNTETSLIYLQIASRQFTVLAQRRQINDKRVFNIAYEIGSLLAVVEPALKQLQAEGVYEISPEVRMFLEAHESDPD